MLSSAGSSISGGCESVWVCLRGVRVIIGPHSVFKAKWEVIISGKGREVVCGQVWWPILGICPLHLTHPSAHSQQWTHTWSSGQPYCGARGAVGGSVPCSRVSPQSWYWRWREHLLFTPPTYNPCRTWESNRQPLGYKSNSLTIRPRLPYNVQCPNTVGHSSLFLFPHSL